MPVLVAVSQATWARAWCGVGWEGGAPEALSRASAHCARCWVAVACRGSSWHAHWPPDARDRSLIIHNIPWRGGPAPGTHPGWHQRPVLGGGRETDL